MFSLVETWAYSLVNLLPGLILLIYPFKGSYRFSKRIVALLIGFITVVQLGLGTWAAFVPDTPSNIKSIVSTVIYLAVYFASIKANKGKMVFTLLMVSNIANLVTVLSKCIEGILAPDMAVQGYRWTFVAVMTVVSLIIYLPLFWYFRRIYVPALRETTDQHIWNYMWIIPLTFYLLWYYLSYSLNGTLLDVALEPRNAVFLLAVNGGAFIVYNAVISLSVEQKKNYELKIKNHQLEINAIEYNSLMSKVREVRRMNHDVRHNIIVMNELLKSKRYDELEKLFSDYLSSLPDTGKLVYSENGTVNILISYFAQLANADGIGFECACGLPAEIDVSDTDIAVLVGNTLENAVEHCRLIKDKSPVIIFRARQDEKGRIFIACDNTCYSEIKANGNNNIYSTKHSGLGIGIQSAQLIAKKHGGFYAWEKRDNMFCVSVMLNPKAE